MRPSRLLPLCLLGLLLSTLGLDAASESEKSKKEKEKEEEAAAKKKKAAEADGEKKPTKSESGASKPKSGSDEKKKTADPTPAKKSATPKEAGPEKPKEADKPKPKEAPAKEDAPAKDVSGSKGNGNMEPSAEFEEGGEIKRKDGGRAKGESTTSTDMAGWEVIRYEGRDYVSAKSLQKFYRFEEFKTEGNAVWLRSRVIIMKGAIGSQELLINSIKFILSYPILELNGKVLFSRLDLCKLIDPVLRPSYIGRGSDFETVIIDPGHGGHDSGAKGVYGYEKDFTLKLAFTLKADLEKRGLKVVMTRSTDTFITLGGRVEFANKVPNSIYVSLHFNSAGTSASGIETYALSPQGASSDYGARDVDSSAFQGNQRDSENIALATAVHASVVHHFKLVDRGVKRARWYVLKGLQRPGILFEGGFVTSPVDCRLIAAENFRVELAHTIGDAISNYKRALKPQ
jgi:N-acetylmuramoyl-L-alanine amidase